LTQRRVKIELTLSEILIGQSYQTDKQGDQSLREKGEKRKKRNKTELYSLRDSDRAVL